MSLATFHSSQGMPNSHWRQERYSTLKSGIWWILLQQLQKQLPQASHPAAPLEVTAVPATSAEESTSPLSFLTVSLFVCLHSPRLDFKLYLHRCPQEGGSTGILRRTQLWGGSLRQKDGAAENGGSWCHHGNAHLSALGKRQLDGVWWLRGNSKLGKEKKKSKLGTLTAK